MIGKVKEAHLKMRFATEPQRAELVESVIFPQLSFLYKHRQEFGMEPGHEVFAIAPAYGIVLEESSGGNTLHEEASFDEEMSTSIAGYKRSASEREEGVPNDSVSKDILDLEAQVSAAFDEAAFGTGDNQGNEDTKRDDVLLTRSLHAARKKKAIEHLNMMKTEYQGKDTSEYDMHLSNIDQFVLKHWKSLDDLLMQEESINMQVDDEQKKRSRQTSV